jgi:hypothetical protein
MVKVGMGSADVVSVVGAAVVVAIDSMALEVVTVSRVTEESVVSTDESVAGAEVAAVTNVVVAIAVADSIDEASDVSVETTEVAADVAVKTSNSVSNLSLKWSVQYTTVLTWLAGARSHMFNGQQAKSHTEKTDRTHYA